MLNTSTTWKYPYAFYDGRVDDRQPSIPDCKVFCFIIATPIFDGVEDPDQDMFGVVPAPDALIERNRVQLHYIRQGLIV